MMRLFRCLLLPLVLLNELISSVRPVTQLHFCLIRSAHRGLAARWMRVCKNSHLHAAHTVYIYIYIYRTCARVIQKFQKLPFRPAFMFFLYIVWRVITWQCSRRKVWLDLPVALVVQTGVKRSVFKPLSSALQQHTHASMQTSTHTHTHNYSEEWTNDEIKGHSNWVRHWDHILRIFPLNSAQKLSWGLACSSSTNLLVFSLLFLQNLQFYNPASPTSCTLCPHAHFKLFFSVPTYPINSPAPCFLS